jgi:hypothetical protein
MLRNTGVENQASHQNVASLSNVHNDFTWVSRLTAQRVLLAGHS